MSTEDFLGNKGNKEWVKYKNFFNVSVPGAVFEFHWAPVIQAGDNGKEIWLNYPKAKVKLSGAKDVLKRILLKDDVELPDIVILSKMFNKHKN